MELHTKNQRNKNANSIKNIETTIIIANTKYAISSVPTQNVKAGNNIVQYKPIGKFSDDEKMLLNQSLKEGYVYINEAYSLLKKAKADTLEKVESILGELEESTLEALLANIQQIQDKILSPKLVVLKENYLDTEKDHVLASVKEDDTFTFTVYENFFDKKEFTDNRAGVIIHEIAHLCDIEEGADMYDVDSAECLKNIILHLNDKITLDEIQAEYVRKQEPQERDDDTLTYDPDQPRVPAGNSKGGQWTAGGSNGGKSSKDDENKSDSKGDNAIKSKDEDSSTNKANFKEKVKNTKSSLNLQAGGIKFDSSKIWGAGDFEINNLEPNKEYTLAGEFTYKYEPIMENKTVTETSKIAIDIRTDENGSAKVNRLGIVGEYTAKGEATKYDGGELGIGVKLSLAEGKTSDNYENIDKFKVEDLTHAENRELREKYGLGYYGMFHACQQKWTNTKNIKAYSGGGISGQKDPDGLVEILNEYIEFDSITGESKISKGLKNNAKGRY